MENDREHRALRDDLGLARRDIATLQDQRFGGAVLALGRDHVPTVRTKTPHVKRRKHTHPMGLLDRVYVALAVHYMTGPSVLG